MFCFIYFSICLYYNFHSFCNPSAQSQTRQKVTPNVKRVCESVFAQKYSFYFPFPLFSLFFLFFPRRTTGRALFIYKFYFFTRQYFTIRLTPLRNPYQRNVCKTNVFYRCKHGFFIHTKINVYFLFHGAKQVPALFCVFITQVDRYSCKF